MEIWMNESHSRMKYYLPFYVYCSIYTISFILIQNDSLANISSGLRYLMLSLIRYLMLTYALIIIKHIKKAQLTVSSAFLHTGNSLLKHLLWITRLHSVEDWKITH